MKQLKYYSGDIIKFTAFLILAAAVIFFIFAGGVIPRSQELPFKMHIRDSSAFEKLGEALFSETLFSSPEGKTSGFKKDQFSQFRVSCKSCHMVDEKLKETGMRGYTDFSRLTPVPYREGDSSPEQFTHRRTQQMLNVAGKTAGAAPVYHWDGEFNEGDEHSSLLKLIETTFASRNMGWREGEKEKARTLRLKVILESEGIAAGKEQTEKVSYRDLYCSALGITKEQFLNLGEENILAICNEAIAFYIENIKTDIQSSFDIFLMENGIDNPLNADEIALNRLLKREDLKFINKVIPVEGSEVITSRKVSFGGKELRGLRLFMDKKKTNCSSCHTPPAFTDNRFHNIGVSEYDYRDIHGKFPGSFYTKPVITKQLSGTGMVNLKKLFQVYPSKENPLGIDLGHGLFSGLWKDFGAFRTPTLRNLKYCDPYLHSGRAETISSAIKHHITASRNKEHLAFISQELLPLSLNIEEIISLEAFLASLNDHYE